MGDVTVVGNVGEPQLKFTPSGKPVLEFSLAENHSKKNQQGGWDEDGTTWRRVAIWDKKAEALAEVLRKGDRVIATGQERIREWDAKDGSKGQSLELSARDVGIIPRAPQAAQGGGYAPAAASTGAWTPDAGAGGWGAQSDGPAF
ncbi:single-stranded DNA-binding protein [Pseudarthrobacter sp. P1]|uniref:single-stranded DNA-binding protein n=1 Tax=Pseudarthrobacter sp. P1 TaxID=3418418 RepID=UPI003CF13954